MDASLKNLAVVSFINLHNKHIFCLKMLIHLYKGGRANVFFKSANRKSANFWAQSAIENMKILLINLQIANPQMS
jgi:hypothetical protein